MAILQELTTKDSSTRSDILRHLLRAGQATAQQVADDLALTTQGIRRHLKTLEAEGLICCESVAMPIGRPQHRYALTAAGRAWFPNSYNQFALSLLQTISETMPEQLGPILKAQWRKKLEDYRPHLSQGSLGDRLAMLVALRRVEGFMSECHVVEVDEQGQGRSFFVTDYNCAIADIAAAFPRVCGHELELYSELLPDCRVDRTHWMIRGESHCGYRIEPQ
jgi:DeoR family transcriptional regulator, suf operon transcriptional repressor